MRALLLLTVLLSGCISAAPHASLSPSPASQFSGTWSLQDPMCPSLGYGTWETEWLNTTNLNLSGGATCIPANGGIVSEAVNEVTFPMSGWCIVSNVYESGCWDEQGVVWYNQTNMIFGYRVNFTRT